MADTGFVRFNAVDSSDWTNANNLIGTNTGDCTSATTGNVFILSSLILNIPDGSTINGIEYQFNSKFSGLGIQRKIKTLLTLESNLGTEHVEDLTSSYTLYSHGSSSTTEGLTGITTSNVENIKLRVETFTATLATLFVEGTTSDPSPAIKVYFTEPTPSPTERSFVLPPVRSSGMYIRES